MRWLWKGFIAFWSIAALLFILMWYGVIGYVPQLEQLQNPIDKYASQVISADGELIGAYAHSGNNRTNTTYEELPSQMVEALVATEDVRFYKHSGIDMRGLGRAIFKTGILRKKSSGGGSTITQQLAKQLFSPRAKNSIERLLQKPIEWVIAIKLERYYTKEEIITFYLNQFDFLYNAVGIRSAALTYYGKEPSELTLTESAMLIGMCKNPSLYNPVLRPDSELPKRRRDVVLKQMKKAGFIDQETLQKAIAEPIETRFHRSSNALDGCAPYFTEHLRLMLTAKKPRKKDYPKWRQEQYAIDSTAWATNPLYGWCNKNKKRDGSNYDLYADGLKIYCTIDTRMQAHAERAVREYLGGYLQPAFNREMKYLSSAPYSADVGKKGKEKAIERAIRQSDRWYQLKAEGCTDAEIRASFDKKRKMMLWSWDGYKEVTMSPRDSIIYYKGILRAGFMAMNPHNGSVLAYVGGPDFRTFKYDMVSSGRRQIGSTVKPFLYSLSLSEGVSPCETIIHAPISIMVNGKVWTPRNTGSRNVGQPVTIKWGLQHSSNWVTAYLMSKMAPATFARFLRSYGINGRIDPVMATALGAVDVTVEEMVAAYSTFVGQGIKASPMYVTRIEDQYGNVVANFTPSLREVLPQDIALKMLDMLRAVVDGGTGGRLRRNHGLSMPMGGKTGTSQNHSDGWFVGFTPQIVAGCWVGGDERAIHFRSMSYGQGAASALPIFGKFMKYVYADKELGYNAAAKFDVPAGFSLCGGVSSGAGEWEDEELSPYNESDSVVPDDYIEGDLDAGVEIEDP